MFESEQKMNYRYRCKIKEVIYNIQLFNIQNDKIKISIETKSSYSDDYIEYSNIYTLVQFQEITRYYALFENIEEVFEDIAHTIKEKKFSIEQNGNTLTLTIKVKINRIVEDANFILDKNKVIDLSSQNEKPYYYNNTISSKSSEKYKKNPFFEKSKRNVEISNINELNTLLSDFKDRITILEANQSNQIYQNKITYDKNYINSIGNNDNIRIGLQNILLRLNKLENDSNNKDKTIEMLEKKLQYYESKNKNPINDNNNLKNYNYLKYSNPTYQNTLPKNFLSSDIFYNNYQLQEQRQSALTFNKNDNDKKYYNNKYRLKQSNSEFLPSYNNENKSFQSKDMNKNNTLRNYSYNDKKISFRDNNKSNGEKDTFSTNRYNNSHGNDNNSSYIKTNNSNLNSTLSNYSNTKDKNFQKYIFYKEKLAIPMVPRENLKKYVNSRIIFTKKELRALKAKFWDGNKKLHIFFDLLYRASVDGDFEEKIRNNTEDKDKTLTLFYTYEGSRFGVYINRKLSTSLFQGKIYKEIPGTSFIVSLNNLKFFDIAENKTSKGDIDDDSLCFGRTFYLNQNGSNWLIYTPRSNFLKKKCCIGNQKGDYKSFDPEILVGSKDEYHIKDVEIFHVAFEYDQEKNK